VIEYTFAIDSSVGRVTGVLWDDGKLAIGSPLVAELDKSGVRGPDSLASALEEVGLPVGEANALASTLWGNALAAYARAAPRPPRPLVLVRELWRRFTRRPR